MEAVQEPSPRNPELPATTPRKPDPPASASLARRFWRYQAERFPLLGFVPLVTAFTFSSAAFSRLARGAPGFVPGPVFATGAFTAIVFFFLLRVLDEHKDADVDRRYRPELPVPRGLIRLSELRWIGGVLLAIALLLNAWTAPILLVPFAATAVWAALMTREFFVRDWLRAHVGAYLITHMLIMPMIDAYTTGLDWLREGAHPPGGLLAFLAVTFLNGTLIEIGRKLKPAELEREGVDTYTKAWGRRRATVAWLLVLTGAAGFAYLAARHTGSDAVALPILVVLSVACGAFGVAFLRAPSSRSARAVETLSQVWPFFTYLLLGSGPFLVRLVSGVRP